MATHVVRLTQLGSAKKLVSPLISSSTIPLNVTIKYCTNTIGEVEYYNDVVAKSDVEGYDTSSAQPFSKEVFNILRAPINENDVEIKLDGIIYLPEIKYRRVLLEAFGAGGWVLVPKSPVRHVMVQDTTQLVTREYALYCHGQFISVAMGEHVYYCSTNIQYGKACESAKSNALMRCCKDLGIASELWDPQVVSVTINLCNCVCSL